MSVPRVLLLTSTPPGNESGAAAVGGIFLRELCQAYPHDRLFCVACTGSLHRPLSQDLSWLPVMTVPLPQVHPVLQRLSRGPLRWLAPSLTYQYTRWVREKRLLAQAVQFGRQHQVELVWAVLGTPLLYHPATSLADRLGVPLVTTVWDPPELKVQLDRLSRHVAFGSFDRAIRQSLRCGVASEAMGEEYTTRYGVQTTVMIHGSTRSQCCPPASCLGSEDHFTIGFAGSFYTDNEWQALLSALSSVNWRIQDRDVVVRILSKNLRVATEGCAHIEYLGWRPMQEAIRVLSECDVNYLPYWFDPILSASVRLCFPNKLTAYVASGRPIFYHGPMDSSPTRFLTKYPVGLCCHSMDEESIVKTLARFISDKALYARMAQETQIAIARELDRQVFLCRFATLVGIAETELVGSNVEQDASR